MGHDTVWTTEEMAPSLQERQELLERLARIQRSISHGAPLGTVLDAITLGASELLEDEVAGLRLLDRDRPGHMYLASAVGMSEEEVEVVRRSPVGAGAGGRAIAENRLVVVEDYGHSGEGIGWFARGGLQAAMAAPVYQRGELAGSLVVASYTPGRRYSELDREMLLALAEHASLALTDAAIIAERERLAARHGEERLGELVRQSSDLISVVDAAGVVTYHSPAVERLLGYEVADLVGRELETIVHSGDTEIARGLIERAAVRAGSTGPVEWRLVPRDADPEDPGSWRHVEVLATNLLHNASVEGIVLNARDITERKRSEEARLRSEERYRRIIETTSEGVWMLDAKQRTVFVNDALARMTGYTRDELLGRAPAEVLAPDQVGLAGPRLERRRSSRPSESFETSLRRSDGESLRVLLTATPIRDDEGEYAGVLALCTDVSSRAAAQAEKAQLEERLQRAQTLEGIGNLAGQIAHDFNNVLAVILNYALFVRDRLPEGERLRDDLDAIIQAAEHGAGLTRQLLLFSRRDAGTPEVLDLNEVVRATVRLVAKSAPAGVQVQERIPETPAPVLIDATQLRQVIMNLVDNAFDAMPDGGEMIVSTRMLELDERDARVRVNLAAGGYAALSIVDAGCGMEPDVAARAIEPMFTTKPRGSGTGFGLSIANGIVEQAGGHLELRSTPHVGTTVEAFLPLTDAPAVAAPVREWIAATSDMQSGRLLLVEDDDAVREMTNRILTHRGYEVVEAPNAAAALEIGLDGIDLLLTDNAMPNMTGVELVDRLRAVSRGIPVIVMSGYVAEATVEAGDAPGIFWLQKPFGATTLLAAVQGALAAAAH